jgi:hypothetical protein
MELLKGYASINNPKEKMKYLSQNVIAIYNFFYLMLYM